MAQQFIPTPGGNIYPDQDTDYDQSEAFRKVALNRDVLDAVIEKEAKTATSTANAANATAGNALAVANGASSDAGNAVARVETLESAAGFGPSTPTDGTMANFIENPASLTGKALSAAIDNKITGRSLDGALAPLRTRLWDVYGSPVPLVFAGDSITQGGGGAVTHARRWVTMLAGYHPLIDSYPACLAAGPADTGLTFLNMGIGGTNALSYLKAVDIPTIGGWNPALVMHNVGTNDSTADWGTPAWVAGQIASKIDALDAAATLPVGHIIVRPQERMDGVRQHDWNQFLEEFDAIAATRPNVGVLDLVPVFGALGWPDSDPADVMDADLVHPNINGNRLYHDTFAPILKLPKFEHPTTVLSDDFTRANGSLIGSSPTVGTGVWTSIIGNFLVEGNRAKADVGSTRFAAIEAGANEDFDLYADVEMNGSAAADEIAFKVLDSGNHYTFNYGPTSLRIRQYIGGVNTSPAIIATGITMTPGVVYRAHIRQRDNIIYATMASVGSLTLDLSDKAASQTAWSKVGFKSSSGSYFDTLLVTKPGV